MTESDDEKQVALFPAEAGRPLSFRELADAAHEGVPANRNAVVETRAVGASTRMARKYGNVVDAVLARRNQDQALAFTPRDFVLFGLPYRMPTMVKVENEKVVIGKDGKPERVPAQHYERKNGPYGFIITAPEGVGVPHGQDRLLIIWLATAFKAAGQPADNTIRFRAASDIIRAFEPDESKWTGRHYNGIGEGLQRLHDAKFLAYDSREPESKKRRSSYGIISDLNVWFHKDAQPNQHTLYQNIVELDAKFANDLRQYAVPVDFNSVRALKANPAALDLYVWQAHRSWRLRIDGGREVKIRVHGPGGLLEQLGSTVSSPRKGRQLIARWQKEVRAVWPECPNQLTTDKDYIIVRAADAIGDAKLDLPGVSLVPPVPLRPVQEVVAGNATLLAGRKSKSAASQP